jgi:hypothetical protein
MCEPLSIKSATGRMLLSHELDASRAGITQSAHFLLTLIAGKCFKDTPDLCLVPNETFATMMECRTETIGKLISQLVKAGLIDYEVRITKSSQGYTSQTRKTVIWAKVLEYRRAGVTEAVFTVDDSTNSDQEEIKVTDDSKPTYRYLCLDKKAVRWTIEALKDDHYDTKIFEDDRTLNAAVLTLTKQLEDWTTAEFRKAIAILGQGNIEKFLNGKTPGAYLSSHLKRNRAVFAGANHPFTVGMADVEISKDAREFIASYRKLETHMDETEDPLVGWCPRSDCGRSLYLSQRVKDENDDQTYFHCGCSRMTPEDDVTLTPESNIARTLADDDVSGEEL